MSRLERLITGNLAESDVVEESGDFMLIEGITCSDGVSLSVQASRSHYSSPRSLYGPYSKVEVGFPGKDDKPFNMPDEWLNYAGRLLIDWDDPDDEDLENNAAQIERFRQMAGGVYQSSNGTYLNGVWAWVPVELVRAFVADHGGEVEE